MRPLPLPELEGTLRAIREAPREAGELMMIVRRPEAEEREVLEEAQVVPAEGLVGDMWVRRPSRHTPDGSPHPGRQLTIVNARAIAAIAQKDDRWALSGDQLYVDLDLSVPNLPPGTLLEIGEALLEITDQPHRGCRKYAERFGPDALRFVNTPAGLELRLRGVYARVIRGGTVRRGDLARKVEAGSGAVAG